MKKNIIIGICGFVLCVLGGVSYYYNQNTVDHLSINTETQSEVQSLENKTLKPLRIGYYEGGAYINYIENMYNIIDALMEIKLISSAELPTKYNDDARIMWNNLFQITSSDSSNLIQVDKNAYWSSGWDIDIRKKSKEAAIKYLNSEKLDLIIAMGTWAGQDLANNEHNVPVIVVDASDPVGSGIIKDVYDSGYDHVFAQCEPDRYKKQVRLFYKMFKFKKLGLAFIDTSDGKAYAAYNDVKAVAAKKGFEVIECHLPIGTSGDESYKGAKKCYDELASICDAMYITEYTGVVPKYMSGLTEKLFENKIPTWSQPGSDLVAYGALISIAKKKKSGVSRFYADVIRHVCEGQSLRTISQIFEEPIAVSINLEAASRLGYQFPDEVTNVADQIFRQIAKFNDK